MVIKNYFFICGGSDVSAVQFLSAAAVIENCEREWLNVSTNNQHGRNIFRSFHNDTVYCKINKERDFREIISNAV